MKKAAPLLCTSPGRKAGTGRQRRQQSISFVLLICLTVCSTALPASAQEPQEPMLIGVLDLEANNVPEGEAKAITDRLRYYLGRQAIFSPIERNQMNELLEEQGFQLTTGACNTDECVIRVGEILGARKMVAGSVSVVGDIYSLQIRLIDIESANIDIEVFSDVNSIGEVLVVATQDVAQKMAAEITGEAGPEAPATTGQVNVTSGPSGANLTIDGQSWGTTPKVVTLDEGPHEVAVTMEGYETFTQTVQIQAGSMTPINATLIPLPAVSTGTVDIISDPPGATVLVDGQEKGTTPLTQLDLPVDTYRIEIRREGYESQFKNVDIRRGSNPDLHVTLERSGEAVLMLDSNFRGAIITIDGVRQSQTTPADAITLRPGPHTIQVKARGYSSWQRSVDLRDGAQERLNVILTPKSRIGTGFLALLPGVGHFYSGRKAMGAAVLLTTAGAYAWALTESSANADAEDAYRLKKAEYDRATFPDRAATLHAQVNAKYQDWKSAQQSAQTAVLTAATVHLLGILHSAIFMPKLQPIGTSAGPTLSLRAGTRTGTATLTLRIIF